METNIHENLVNTIRNSIEWHREHDTFYNLTFYFSAPEATQDALFSDKNVAFVRKTFENIGLVPQPCDTIPHSFNLNRDYEEVSCPRCVREYGFSLPVSDDLDSLARIVELEHAGLVQFIVYENEQG